MRTPIAAAVLLAFAGWHLTAYAQSTGASAPPSASSAAGTAAAVPTAASAANASAVPAHATAATAVPLDTVVVTA